MPFHAVAWRGRIHVQQDARLTNAFRALPKVATTVTANGAAVVSKHNPVDATGAAKALSLATGQAEGKEVSIEKTDSVNAVSITGNIRGVAASTLTLALAHETNHPADRRDRPVVARLGT